MTLTVTQNVNRLSLTVSQELNEIQLQPIITVNGDGFDGNINGGTP